jgi:hypothetical protein
MIPVAQRRGSLSPVTFHSQLCVRVRAGLADQDRLKQPFPAVPCAPAACSTPIGQHDAKMEALWPGWKSRDAHFGVSHAAGMS